MRLKRVLAGLAALGALLLIGVAAFLYTLDFDRYRDVVAEQAKALTGRDLKIGGKLQLDLFAAAPALVAEDVTLANAPWGTRPDMLRVKRLELQVRLRPLLSGRLEIVRLILVEPDLLLETDRAGQPNWRFEPAGAGPAGVAPATTAELSSELPSVEDLRLERATIAYRDGASGSMGTLLLKEATLKAVSVASPIALAIHGALDGRPVDISGSFGPLATLMAGRTYPAKFEGRFGGSDIGGTLEAELGHAPIRLKGALSSKTLDLADFGGSGKSASGGRARGKLFDATPLDLGFLKSLAGELTYNVDRLAGIAPALTNIRAKAVIRDGVLTLAPLGASVADGVFDGQLTLDARATLAQASLKGTLKGAAVATVTKAVAGSALISAPLDIDIDATGSGASVAAIMASLSGHLTATVGPGPVHSDFYAVLSTSPLSAVNPLGAGEGPPRLNCIVARFDFAGGRGQSRVLLADSTRSTVLGRGVVSLGDEYVDILMVPSTKQVSAASVASLVPVRLRGPLADPSFTPDPGQAAMETAKSIIGLAELPLNIVGSVLGFGRIAGRGGGDTCAAAIARAGGAAAAGAGQTAPPKRDAGGFLERLNPFGR
jgi:uncharacterized protein involved in outer membrane biogenesis